MRGDYVHVDGMQLSIDFGVRASGWGSTMGVQQGVVVERPWVRKLLRDAWERTLGDELIDVPLFGSMFSNRGAARPKTAIN